MKIERTTLTVTSIHDRNGRRIANYIVDKSDDALNREREKDFDGSERPFLPDKPHEGDDDQKLVDSSSTKKPGVTLDITA